MDVEEKSGMALSGSEDEVDDEVAAKKHQQLVNSLSTLAGGKRRRAAERTEASRQVSEFDVGCGGAAEKVLLSELLQPVSTSSALGSVRKQLRRVKEKKAVELPLSKEESERVVREAAFTQTSRALAKWDPVVQQNRRAEQQVFPLQQQAVTVAPVEEVISSWQARTPLEQEIFSLLHKTQQPVKAPLLTPHEKASLQAMSLEEAQVRRKELQRARALQSYYEAKMRRERKIKSKKYRKVLRKGRSGKVLKEFEMLQKSNPEAALVQLEKLERARMEERMSLKHQNKGRWAKSTVLMAKYDLEARQAMQEQLALNKELMQKVYPALDSNEGGDDLEAEQDLVPDVLNEKRAGLDPENPWMLGKVHAESKQKPSVPEDSEEEEALPMSGPSEEDMPPMLLPAPPSPASESPFLNEKLERLKTLEDMETLELEDVPQEAEPQRPAEAELLPQAQGTKAPAATKKGKHKALIDLKAVLTEAPQAILCPLVPSGIQDEELETTTDQRRVIQEAFASDNVIADFLKEKHRAEQDSKPKAINLVLPGWGEWGGTGLRPSAKKRKRFLIKPKPGPPRRDQHLPHVILSEKRNILAAGHQVNQVPFPFENSQQFECSIQAPVGHTWNTRHTFQRLTAPRVITQPGHIIRPISAEDANLTRKGDVKVIMGKKPALEFKVSPTKRRRRHSSSKKKEAQSTQAKESLPLQA